MKDFLINNFNPILLVFASYTLGVFGTGLLKVSGLYNQFENHNYIGDRLTHNLGVLKFAWLIRNSFMGIFNPKLKLSGKSSEKDLTQLKEDMTFAENNHLIGFLVFQFVIFLFAVWEVAFWQILIYTIINVIFNLYLVFLQQYNKRRIDKVLNNYN